MFAQIAPLKLVVKYEPPLIGTNILLWFVVQKK